MEIYNLISKEWVWYNISSNFRQMFAAFEADMWVSGNYSASIFRVKMYTSRNWLSWDPEEDHGNGKWFRSWEHGYIIFFVTGRKWRRMDVPFSGSLNLTSRKINFNFENCEKASSLFNPPPSEFNRLIYIAANLTTYTLQPWRWNQYVPPKRWFPPTNYMVSQPWRS